MVAVFFAAGLDAGQVGEGLLLRLHDLVEVIVAAFGENAAVLQAVLGHHEDGLAVLDFDGAAGAAHGALDGVDGSIPVGLALHEQVGVADLAPALALDLPAIGPHRRESAPAATTFRPSLAGSLQKLRLQHHVAGPGYSRGHHLIDDFDRLHEHGHLQGGQRESIQF